SICRAPVGTATRLRGPTAVMRPPSISTIASEIGAPPLPSMTVPPIRAVTAAGTCAAGRAIDVNRAPATMTVDIVQRTGRVYGSDLRPRQRPPSPPVTSVPAALLSSPYGPRRTGFLQQPQRDPHRQAELPAL